jgi:hypothetical protein
MAAQLASYPPFPLSHLAFPLADVATPSYHGMLPSHRAKISFAASALSSGNTSYCHLPSQVKTEALNLHHHCQPPFLERLTPTIHCYKKVISIKDSKIGTGPKSVPASFTESRKNQ